MKKYLFYLFFAALGIYNAEAYNIPGQLICPPLYLIYGLLYLLFIDQLIRNKEKRFRVFYLYGALVGIITESYVAKVLFWGLKPNAVTFLGIAPGAVGFIILFFHAFVSFLIPVYLAGRLLNYPFNIKYSRKKDFLVLFYPIIRYPIILTIMAQHTYSSSFLISRLLISSGVLIFWLLLLRFAGKIENILLTKKEVSLWIVLSLLFYTFATFTMTNKAHGHEPTDFPLNTMIAVTLFILFILFIQSKSMQTNLKKIKTFEFSMNKTSKYFFGWLLIYLCLNFIPILLAAPLQPIIGKSIKVLALFGLLTGYITFIICFGAGFVEIFRKHLAEK